MSEEQFAKMMDKINKRLDSEEFKSELERDVQKAVERTTRRYKGLSERTWGWFLKSNFNYPTYLFSDHKE